MKNPLLFLLLLLVFGSCSKNDGSGGLEGPQLEIRGADISLLPEVRKSGVVVRNAEGQPEDMLLTLKNEGVNVIRLRLWKEPETPTSGLRSVKALSQEVKSLGLKILLSVHYSDSWADPGHQEKPSQWMGITYEQLKDSVYAYTALVASEIQPEYIQIGNEINGGLLWPEGSYEHPAQMHELLEQGIRAVRDYSPSTKIILHYAGHKYADNFFIGLASLDYDIAGISYYPYWHGKDLAALQANLTQIVNQTDKPVLIVETSYPFSLEWNDWTDNVVGMESQLINGYPATPEGQKTYLHHIKELMLEVEKGLGFCYWGAEWISYKGENATNGSTWENQALWNFSKRALPAQQVFKTGN